jgi:hypothetical protein
MRLVDQDTGLVFLDFGGDAFDEFLDDRKLVRVRSDDGDDVDFSRGHRLEFLADGLDWAGQCWKKCSAVLKQIGQSLYWKVGGRFQLSATKKVLMLEQSYFLDELWGIFPARPTIPFAEVRYFLRLPMYSDRSPMLIRALTCE